jgi:hypothetical protein
MATLTTAVVNAGYPISGAPLQVQRGTINYFSVVKNISQLYDNNTLRDTVPQTDFTSNTARNSLVYNNPVTFVALVGTTPYQSVVKYVAYTESEPIIQVEMKTNPYYYANVRLVNSSVNETKEGTVGFYHNVAVHSFATTSTELVVDPKTNLAANAINSLTLTSVNEEPIAVMNNANFNQNLGTRSVLQQDSGNVVQIFTKPFFSGVANNITGTISVASVMDTTTFNKTLGTRDGKLITTPSEEPIFVLNVANTYTNQNSPAQVVLNNVSTRIVEQNNNLGRLNSTAIQPKGTEAGNIGFAQAFGNTTIVGKWF